MPSQQQPDDLDVVRAAARRGARLASSRRQVIEDAAEEAANRWVQALLRRKEIRAVEAWAFRVGANAAKRLGTATSRSCSCEHSDPGTALLGAFEETENAACTKPAHYSPEGLRARIEAFRGLLTQKQFVVAMKLSEAGMSITRAAKELAMDRSSLRRTFIRALSRFSVKTPTEKSPSPPSNT